MTRDVPAKPIVLTKEQGATRQTLAAIEAFFKGEFDVAITLAGAAEGMLEREGPHLFKFLLEHPSVAHFRKKEVATTINAERDWLKHVSGPEPVQIHRSAAAFMIVRAASKLAEWPPRVWEFRDWVIENLDSLADG
jgi:hypothetical protein